jgi:hypothetical protein
MFNGVRRAHNLDHGQSYLRRSAFRFHELSLRVQPAAGAPQRIARRHAVVSGKTTG